MEVETKGGDEKVILRLKSIRCLTNLRLFGRERFEYMAKHANMAKRRGREIVLRLIFFFFFFFFFCEYGYGGKK